ncbi:MAG: cysteine desulfurase-like protein [Anaerolineaceae bacterium]|nr:cysteine desulfurase-like protein [Anaerolineaceae bacterium]
MTLDLDLVRSQFPALSRPAIFLDNPGGTQIAQQSIKKIQSYLVESNANSGGAFPTSADSDRRVRNAREAAADFLNASRPEEIVFGPNMTSLTYQISRSLGRTFQPGDTIVVTRLDHDANISPWLQIAEDRGCSVRWVDFHPEDGTLDLEDLKKALESAPKLVAVGYASNALGTINPLKTIIPLVHAAGALVYVDAVQYAPHGPIDVQDLGCDFLACSSYKFFGPHLGILYGKYDLLDQLTAYRVRPAPAQPPSKFETGTGNFEAICGLHGALDYFEWAGKVFAGEYAEIYRENFHGRKLLYKQALAAIHSYEMDLSRAFISTLQSVPGLKAYGLMDTRKLDQRVPTFSFTLEGWTPLQVAGHLTEARINVWNGNFYALAVTERLGLEDQGGLVRVGATHYNTLEEITWLESALKALAN